MQKHCLRKLRDHIPCLGTIRVACKRIRLWDSRNTVEVEQKPCENYEEENTSWILIKIWLEEVVYNRENEERLLALSIIWICAIEILRERDEDVRTKSGMVASLKFETLPSFQEQKETGENFSEKMMLPEFISAGEKKEGKKSFGKKYLANPLSPWERNFYEEPAAFWLFIPQKVFPWFETDTLEEWDLWLGQIAALR